MKKLKILFIIALINCLLCLGAYSQNTAGQLENPQEKQLAPLTGNVQQNTYGNITTERPTGYIKDSLSGKPIAGAQVAIPDKNLSTISKSDGSFKLNLKNQEGNFIVSVKKEGYLPFALNAQKEDFSAPFTLHIQKQTGELVIDHQLHHLGDNNFSQGSANSGAFKKDAEGPVFTKDFYVEELPKKNLNLRIGSVIGLDTMASRELGQSKLDTFSTPLSIYVNSVKIAEIGINGNNKVVPIPRQILKAHSKNLIVLETGVNQIYRLTHGMDYDDMEFMNLILEHEKQ